MAEVVLSSQDLVVLGGPSKVEVDINFGVQGTRGTRIYGLSADPRLATTTKPEDLIMFDIAIIISPTEDDYRIMYQKNGPGDEDWVQLIDLNLGAV
tara:strand:- start:3499 stop:3786 length:288 start_codon:yes stop_codon:yes gene_type:complete